MIETALPDQQGVVMVTKHLYVKDVGEVERETSIERDQESRVIGESKRVDNAEEFPQ